jgi:orotate phosphoribosyltransferase-like protein
MDDLEAYRADLHTLGWTQKRLADELELSSETLRLYAKAGPTRAVRIAVAAMAKGFRL